MTRAASSKIGVQIKSNQNNKDIQMNQFIQQKSVREQKLEELEEIVE